MALSEGAKLKESKMQFVVSKQNLQRELGFVQGVVEKKNTIPVLSNILIESVGENTIRITGTDLDVTIRCNMDAEDISANDCALANNDARLFSSHNMGKGEKLWIITEWDRSVTTFLLPSEY